MIHVQSCIHSRTSHDRFFMPTAGLWRAVTSMVWLTHRSTARIVHTRACTDSGTPNLPVEAELEAGWRERGAMTHSSDDLHNVTVGAVVKDSDGAVIGSVERLEDDVDGVKQLMITRHGYAEYLLAVPRTMIEAVSGGEVRLNVSLQHYEALLFEPAAMLDQPNQASPLMRCSVISTGNPPWDRPQAERSATRERRGRGAPCHTA